MKTEKTRRLPPFYKRKIDVAGNYKPILPRLADARLDRVNLEFAYTGTGDATDLELLPAHLGVGMGVVDVRTEKPQSVEEIEAIGAAGAEVISPDRIALNPDCGFAPDAGEPPSIEEAFIKLKRLCAAAERLRGRACRTDLTADSANPADCIHNLNRDLRPSAQSAVEKKRGVCGGYGRVLGGIGAALAIPGHQAGDY